MTTAGLAAIGVADESDSTSPTDRRAKAVKGRARGKVAGSVKVFAKAAAKARTAGTGGTKETKQDIVLAMLRRDQGASVAEMMAATNWQAHSVRGFMSGALKKRLGLEVVSDKKTGERRYYVAALK